jgi:hypothetical protein
MKFCFNLDIWFYFYIFIWNIHWQNSPFFFVPSKTQHGLAFHWGRQLTRTTQLYQTFMLYFYSWKTNLFLLTNSIKRKLEFLSFIIGLKFTVYFYAILQVSFHNFHKSMRIYRTLFRFNLSACSWSIDTTSCDVIHMTFIVFILKKCIDFKFIRQLILFIMPFKDYIKSTFHFEIM